MGIITESDHKNVNKRVPVCETAIKLCGTDGTTTCMAAYLACNTIFSSIKSIAGNINHYDIRKQCEGILCYDFSDMKDLLSKQSVKEALGVGDIDFVSCSSVVYQTMIMDGMRNLEAGIHTCLKTGLSCSCMRESMTLSATGLPHNYKVRTSLTKRHEWRPYSGQKMKMKKQKCHRRSVAFFTTCYNFRAPFKILCGRTAISNILGAPVKLFTTRCVLAELKILGAACTDSLNVARDLAPARCDHEKRKSVVDCLTDVIGEKNSEHFFVASQDADLRKHLQEVPAAPFNICSSKCFISRASISFSATIC